MSNGGQPSESERGVLDRGTSSQEKGTSRAPHRIEKSAPQEVPASHTSTPSEEASTPAQALVALQNFRSNPDPGRFRLDRIEVADRLEELVNQPHLISQGLLFLCGPAVFFRVWIARDPLAFVSYAISLYNKGSGRIGTLKITPNPDLKAQTHDPRWNCPTADWMTMSALRDDENLVLDFTGTPTEAEIRAATEPSEVGKWLKATGLYRVVRTEASSLDEYPLSHALNSGFAQSVDTIWYVHSKMLPDGDDKPGFLDSANHFMLLRSPVRVEGDKVKFRFWSWGDPDRTAEPSKDLVAETYHGNIVAFR